MNNYGADFLGMSRDAFTKQQRNMVRDQYMGVASGIADGAAGIAIGAATGGAAGGAVAAGAAGAGGLLGMSKETEGGYSINPLTATFSVPMQFLANKLSQKKQIEAEREAGQLYDAYNNPVQSQMRMEMEQEEEAQRNQAYLSQTQSMRRNVIPNRVDYLKFM